MRFHIGYIVACTYVIQEAVGGGFHMSGVWLTSGGGSGGGWLREGRHVHPAPQLSLPTGLPQLQIILFYYFNLKRHTRQGSQTLGIQWDPLMSE